MNKKIILLLGLCILLLSSFTIADLNDGLVRALTFDTGTFTAVNVTDQVNDVPYNYDATATGQAGISGEAFNLTNGNPQDNFINLSKPLEGLGSWSIKLNYKLASNICSTATAVKMGSYAQAGEDLFFEIETSSDATRFLASDGTNKFDYASSSLDAILCDGAEERWVSLVMLQNYSNRTMRLFFDGVEQNLGVNTQGGSNGDTWTSTKDLIMGVQGSGGTFAHGMTGLIDEIYVYNRILSDAETLELNSTFYIDFVPSLDVNESIENTAVVKQVGSVNVGGGTATIISSDFNLTRPVSDLYGVYTFNVLSNQNNDLFCEMIIDGVQRANQTRTNTAGELGSMTLTTNMFNLTNGTFTQSLECSRTSGTGAISVFNTIGIGHFMFDEFNRSINHESQSLTVSTNSSTEFQKVGGFNFTISNLTSSNASIQNMLTLEWSAEYENNGLVDENLSTVISINGTNCSFYPRTVDALSSGSVGGSCLMKNVTTNATYEIELFARGSDATFSGNIIAKEFLMSSSEIGSSDALLTGTNFSGATASLIINDTGGNINHALANSFNKVSFSLSANQSTTATFFINISNGATFASVNFTRDVDENIGVLIGQDVLENLPEDEYLFQLWATCPDATCTIEGGTFIGYLTDITTTVLNAFNVTANNSYNGSTILEFNVTDGGTFITTSGSALVFNENNLVNLTINSDGFLPVTIMNHNTSQDLNVELFQTLTNVTSSFKGDGRNILNFNITDGIIFRSTINGSLFLPLNVGSYNFTVESSGYNNEIVSYDINSLNNSGFLNVSLGNTTLNVSAFNLLTGASIINFTATLYTNDNFYNETKSTTNGKLNFSNFIGNFTLLVDNENFALTRFNITQENQSQFFNASLFTTNSINITFKDAETDTVLSGINITVRFIGTTAQTNITDTGTLYVDLLSPDQYTITFDAEGYNQGNYILTVNNRSTTELILYMQNDTNTQLILMTVTDKFGTRLEGAEVTIQRYINNVWQTEQIVATDFQGNAEGYFILSTEFYIFIVEFEDESFIGVPNNDADKKVMYAEDVTNGLFFRLNLEGDPLLGDYYDSVNVDALLNYTEQTNRTGFFSFYWNNPDNSAVTSCLEVTSGNTIICSCASTSVTSESGIITCSINNTADRATFRAVGIIDTFPIISLIINIGEDGRIDWGADGFFFGFFIVLIFFMMLDVPSTAIILGTVVFSVLGLLGLMFAGLSITTYLILIAISVVVATIQSKSGVNT